MEFEFAELSLFIDIFLFFFSCVVGKDNKLDLDADEDDVGDRAVSKVPFSEVAPSSTIFVVGIVVIDVVVSTVDAIGSALLAASLIITFTSLTLVTLFSVFCKVRSGEDAGEGSGVNIPSGIAAISSGTVKVSSVEDCQNE